MTKQRGIALAVIVVLALGVVWAVTRDSTHSTFTAPRTVAITYQVHGSTSGADLTYTTSAGITQQQGMHVPLTRKSDSGDGIIFQLPAGSVVTLSAQNTESSGDVECLIVGSNGQTIASNKATGGYAIASCTGRAA